MREMRIYEVSAQLEFFYAQSIKLENRLRIIVYTLLSHKRGVRSILAVIKSRIEKSRISK